MQGLTYVRGRREVVVTETGTLTREAGQFPEFLSAPVRSPNRLRLPAGPITPTSGAVVIYFDPDNAYNAGGQAAFGHVFNWQTDTNNRIISYYNKASARWEVVRRALGVETSVVVASTFAAGQAMALYVGWNATTLFCAVNGGAVVSIANAQIPVTLPALIDIGSELGGGNYFAASYGAVSIHSAPLSTNDWERLSEIRSSRPPIYGEGSNQIALWHGNNKLLWDSAVSVNLNSFDMSDFSPTGFRAMLIEGMGAPGVRNHTQPFPNGDGSAYIGSFLEERYVTTQLLVLGLDWADIRRKRRELVAKLNPKLGMGVLIHAPDENIFEVDAIYERGAEYATPMLPFGEKVAPNFRCPSSIVRVNGIASHTVTTIPSGLAIPLIIPMVINPAGTLIPVDYTEGSVEYWPIVTGSFVGSASGLVVTNETTGKKLQINASFVAGETLTVDFGARTAFRNGVDSLMPYLSADSLFWPLAPELVNNVRIEMLSGAITATFRYQLGLLGE